jgi:hypothetical protein
VAHEMDRFSKIIEQRSVCKEFHELSFSLSLCRFSFSFSALLFSPFRVIVSHSQNYFSKDANSDKLTALQLEIDMTKNIVTENIEKIIERGEHIDMLVERTGQLSVR